MIDLIIALFLISLMFLIAILPILVIIVFSIVVLLIGIRMKSNSIADKRLNIETTGIRKWEDGKAKVYHRTESTPYKALETLYENYSITKENSVVDFGSGRGRVAFFMHKKYGVDVTGIELNELTIEEAEENLKSYYEKNEHNEFSLRFLNVHAEKYAIEEKDDTFFFFNPFNHTIFDMVIDNIVEDAKRHQKDITVILYYPTRPYRKIMNERDEFYVHKKFNPKGRISPTEKFIIYKLDK